MSASRYIIADGTTIQRYPVTIYRERNTAEIEARNLALGVGSDKVAAYDMDGRCIFTVLREEHGTRARCIDAANPFAPNGGSWLDWRGDSTSNYIARHVYGSALEDGAL